MYTIHQVLTVVYVLHVYPPGSDSGVCSTCIPPRFWQWCMFYMYTWFWQWCMFYMYTIPTVRTFYTWQWWYVLHVYPPGSDSGVCSTCIPAELYRNMNIHQCLNLGGMFYMYNIPGSHSGVCFTCIPPKFSRWCMFYMYTSKVLTVVYVLHVYLPGFVSGVCSTCIPPRFWQWCMFYMYTRFWQWCMFYMYSSQVLTVVYVLHVYLQGSDSGVCSTCITPRFLQWCMFYMYTSQVLTVVYVLHVYLPGFYSGVCSTCIPPRFWQWCMFYMYTSQVFTVVYVLHV